jgi:hypothetical protein
MQLSKGTKKQLKTKNSRYVNRRENLNDSEKEKKKSLKKWKEKWNKKIKITKKNSPNSF